MEFKFDPNQEYQLQAIEAVVNLFEGQPRNNAKVTFALGATGFASIANQLDLDQETLLENLRNVQIQNNLSPSSSLAFISSTIEAATGVKQVYFPNFSVEMETGTGKTYVYLRTAIALAQSYGFRKFIIVVPSVAVREGVLKTLKITEKHLRELYDNIPYRYYSYDSTNLTQVRQFALSHGVEFMVMTIDSFNKASNIIRQTTDHLQGETPIHLVQAARPILILDEPQNMESEVRIKALAALDPLFVLRYSATHRNSYNLIYRLTPFEAYRQGLVKRIEVASVMQENDIDQAFVRLENITTQKKTLTARIAVHKLMRDGMVKESTITVKPGDSLEERTERSEYKGFEVDEINLSDGFVRFANNVTIYLGEIIGTDKQALFEAQIRYTLTTHMRKEERLRDAGIKVLSLFFIDKVDNYAHRDGIIRQTFTQIFNDLKAKSPYWRDLDAAEVQAAYFAQRRTKSGEVILEDSKSGESEKDKDAYDLIMKDKERLLSFSEPVAFIFSHSALREGWDNPNIFQICTLNQTRSEIKKRQEVGRGVRLAVNQTGDRVHDERVNVLTVVANESYEHYVEKMQLEIKEEYGEDGLAPKPLNARKRGVATLHKEYVLKPEFKELWERIKYKIRYAVKIDQEKLISDVLSEIDQIKVQPPRVTISKAQVQVESDQYFTAIQMSSPTTVLKLVDHRVIPNLIELIIELMERTTPPVHLTRRTIWTILQNTQNKSAMHENPQEFATYATRIIRDKLSRHLIEGIQYQKVNEWYEMTQIQAQVEAWEDHLVAAPHSLYDKVEYESDIEKEFVQGLEKRGDVKLYLKLPSWFTIPTPAGAYNPDWAIVMEQHDEYGLIEGKPLLYLVRETKSTTDYNKLRPDEKSKIQYGKKSFEDALGINYGVIVKASDLP